MLNSIFSAGTATTTGITTLEFFEATAASLVLGLLCAFLYMYKNKYNKNFVVTLALMPAIVQLVIMLVNGNVGAGVAVMGAFSLVRFRSIPGTAKDIGSIFFAMAVGLATGMGYIVVAFAFLICFGIMNIVLNSTKFGEQNLNEKQLRITIPENLDYTGIFDDLFAEYTKEHTLVRVKTTNMGSLFELTYIITFKESNTEKAFIDELRCRNGNLKIICGIVPDSKDMI